MERKLKFEQHFSQKQNQKQLQKLAMTQQLQQSIQILQFNTEELLAFVEEKTLENPLIELEQPDFSAEFSKKHDYTHDETNQYINQIPATHESLFESLIEQVHLNYRDTYLRTLVLYLIEFIDLNGYLTLSLEEACEQTGASAIQMLDALTLIQQLDPAGVGARHLQECLMLQTERNEAAPNLAYVVLEEHFDNLANRKWDRIAKSFDVRLGEVQEIFDYIQTLTPTPGAIFGSYKDGYITPDLKLTIEEDQLQLQSTRNGRPVLHFQQNYFERMSHQADVETQQYLKEKQQEFEWLKKTIQQRGDTILRVGEAIVLHQQAFFLDSQRPIKPLTLKEIADRLDIHESTVSRSVNGKYLETPFGIFELRSFFGAKLSLNSGVGEEISTDNVKKRIQAIIDSENKQKPFSDQKLVEILKNETIDISRRTVAKYREALGIPSSSKRKRYTD